MNIRSTGLALLSVLAITFGSPGCSDDRNPTAPTTEPLVANAPQAARVVNDLPDCNVVMRDERQTRSAIQRALLDAGDDLETQIGEDRFWKSLGEQLHCSARPATQADRLIVEALAPDVTVCTPAPVCPAYEDGRDYCGLGSARRNSLPDLAFHVAECLNDYCCNHDICYDRHCVGNTCSWSPQTESLCDNDVLNACNAMQFERLEDTGPRVPQSSASFVMWRLRLGSCCEVLLNTEKWKSEAICSRVRKWVGNNDPGEARRCERLGGGICVCGDGQLHDDEQCEDGNLNNGDGCSSTCKDESTPRPVPGPTATPPTGINCNCATSRSHGQYVSCVTRAADDLRARGQITNAQRTCLTNAAAQSNCGKSPSATAPNLTACLGPGTPTPPPVTPTPPVVTPTPPVTPTPVTCLSPSLNNGSPSTITGIRQFDLTLNGSCFDAPGAVDRVTEVFTGNVIGSGVLSGGLVNLTTTQMVVTETMVGAAPWDYDVRVENLNGNPSGAFRFTLVPEVTVSPTTTSAGVSIAVTGRGFTKNFGATTHVLRLSDSLELATHNKATDGTGGFSDSIDTTGFSPGSYEVWSVDDNVNALQPGKGVSPRVTFSISATATSLVITSVSPNPVPWIDGPQSFSILGTGFVSGLTVTLVDLTSTEPPFPCCLAGVPITIGSTLINTLPDFVRAGETPPHAWTVQVTNPGGQTSNIFPFRVGP